ncbi:MAG: hypothetical protein Q4G61_07535 [Tissierellia bacterium]|nr:hypothetical protein [Tissierellia bacterium]
MSSNIWLLITIALFVVLVVVIVKKIRPIWRKLLSILVILLLFFFSAFNFAVPMNPPLPASGPFGVRNEKAFYQHETKYPDMATEGQVREIPVSLWLPDVSDGVYPLIIFSHGSFGVADSNMSLFDELASHGYIVASLDHPYHSFTTTLSDGKSINIDIDFMQNVMRSQGAEDLEVLMEDFNKWKSIRVEDISFVMDSLLSDAKYKDRINSKQIILSGHSLGGTAALELGRTRSNELIGVVSLEAPFFGDIVGIDGDEFVFIDDEYPLPVLHFYSDALWGRMNEITTYEMNQRLIDAKSDKYVNVHIEGSGHIGLSELSLVSPILTNALDQGMNTTPVYEKIAKINEATLQFLEVITN